MVPWVGASPEVAWLALLDVVVTSPESPVLTESPVLASLSVDALPVFPVLPVAPVSPLVAAAWLPQDPVTVMQGATAMAGPESPESPELPLLPLVAVPPAVASPVSPEEVAPELAAVWLDELDVASPVVPPVTWLITLTASVSGLGGASWASALSASMNSTPAPNTAPMACLSHRDDDMCVSFDRVGLA